jgi:hypothetical protein
MMNQTEIWAYDRRNAAVHEAGHTVIGIHIGLLPLPQAWIEPVANPQADEKSWVGRTLFAQVPRSKRGRRMFAVAGSVAEAIWRGGDLVDTDCWYDPLQMSPSDWQLAECEPGSPDRACLFAIEEVAKLLARTGRLRSALVRQARRLIEDSRVHLQVEAIAA